MLHKNMTTTHQKYIQDAKGKETIRQEILAALKRAEKVAKPALEDLISDVYDKPIPSLQKQYEELKEHILQLIARTASSGLPNPHYDFRQRKLQKQPSSD